MRLSDRGRLNAAAEATLTRTRRQPILATVKVTVAAVDTLRLTPAGLSERASERASEGAGRKGVREGGREKWREGVGEREGGNEERRERGRGSERASPEPPRAIVAGRDSGLFKP